MSSDIYKAILEYIHKSGSKASLSRLVETIRQTDLTLAAILDKYLEKGGFQYFDGQISEKERLQMQIVYICIQVLSQDDVLKLVIECAKKTLPIFEAARPRDSLPRQILEQLEQSIVNKLPKIRLKQFKDQLQELATEVDSRWHEAYGNGEYDSLPKRELDLSSQPVLAIQVVLSAANAAIASKKDFLECVITVINTYVETELISKPHGRNEIVSWVNQQLAEIVQKHLE